MKIAEGALAGILGLGLSYLLVFVLDRFFRHSRVGAGGLLAAGFTVPALGCRGFGIAGSGASALSVMQPVSEKTLSKTRR